MLFWLAFHFGILIYHSIDLLIATRKEWKLRQKILKNLTKKKPKKKNLLDGEIAQQCPPLHEVEKLYNEITEKKDQNKRKHLSPNVFKMIEFEMNLRKYRIVGGIYSIEYFDQPQQNVKLSPNAFLRTSLLAFIT